MLKVFEAFAGYGSQRMALENIGVPHDVVAISEIDKFAIRSYEAIHGETLNLGDITQINVDDVPDHDLFTYSFPCQDISTAGKQEGFDKGSGTRSGLLWECERIISSKKPKYLLMENVKNLVGKKFMGGFQEWIDYLESVGYSNYWQVLNAKDYGIPQNRERVFMVSILGDHTPYQFPEPFKLEMRLKDILEETVDEKYYLSEERTEKLISTITARYDAGIQNYNSIGGAVIESERILGIFDRENSTHQAGSVYNKDKIAPTLDTMQGGWRQPSIIVEPKIAASRGRNKENPSDRTKGIELEQRLEVNENGTSNTVTTVQKDNYVLEPTTYGVSMNRNEINSEVEVAHTLLARDYKGFGNQNMTGVVSKKEFGRMGRQAVETQNKLKLKHGETLNPWNKKQSSRDGVAPTLTTRPEGFKTAILPVVDDTQSVVINPLKGKTSNGWHFEQQVYDPKGITRTVKAGGGSGNIPKVIEELRIRKLTPLECWRLMGVKDELFYKAQEVNSNTQLYKQAGNSIVVNVLEGIFRNMI